MTAPVHPGPSFIGQPAGEPVTTTSPTGTGPISHTGTHTVKVVDLPWWQRLPRRGLGRLAELNRLSGVQPAGWLVLLLVIASWVVGTRLGWVELRFLAIAGAVVWLAAIAFTLGRQTYAVDLKLENRRVVVGERALGELKVVNTSSRRLLPARIELPVGRRTASFWLPSLGGKASFDEIFAVPTSRRSVITVGPARTVRGDPFRLMGREILWTSAVDLFVHPRTVALPGRQAGFIRDLEGHVTPEISNSDVSFHALREYVPGDDRRYVHWRSSARTGTLMVKQFEETRRSHVGIGLNLVGNAYDSDEEFELAVSIVGSIAVQTLRDENGLDLLTTAGRLKAVTPRSTLDELCRVEMQNSGSLIGTTQSLARHVPGASVLVVVSGSHTSALDLRRACTIFDVDVRILTIRVETSAAMSVSTINNNTMITIGKLDQLPRAMRRAA
ncbi:MAG: DUF58 domain-containing protein [Propionibacterium sp.]|nr:DUF58 domain-containing protein [Propionibacterium sp.]